MMAILAILAMVAMMAIMAITGGLSGCFASPHSTPPDAVNALQLPSDDEQHHAHRLPLANQLRIRNSRVGFGIGFGTLRFRFQKWKEEEVDGFWGEKR